MQMAAEVAHFSCKTVTLNAGDVLIFRGDLVHAGSAHSSDEVTNVRIHCYLEPSDGSIRRQHEADGSEVTTHCKAILPRKEDVETTELWLVVDVPGLL